MPSLAGFFRMRALPQVRSDLLIGVLGGLGVNVHNCELNRAYHSETCPTGSDDQC